MPVPDAIWLVIAQGTYDREWWVARLRPILDEIVQGTAGTVDLVFNCARGDNARGHIGNCDLVAGTMALDQQANTLSLAPHISWAVVEPPRRTDPDRQILKVP